MEVCSFFNREIVIGATDVDCSLPYPIAADDDVVDI